VRQKVVSILILLGVVFSIFRCGSGEKEENAHEVTVSTGAEGEAIHHEQVEASSHVDDGIAHENKGHASEGVVVAAPIHKAEVETILT